MQEEVKTPNPGRTWRGKPNPPEEEPVDVPTYLHNLLQRARAASDGLSSLTASVKNAALQAMAEGLESATDAILEENAKDLERFETSNGREALADRLTLTPERIHEMADGLRQIAKLRDPVGQSAGAWNRPNGMKVGRVRVPIGVIGIIYESRPNVTADAAALCLKSGNACVLRGGSEAVHSNAAIARILSGRRGKGGDSRRCDRIRRTHRTRGGA